MVMTPHDQHWYDLICQCRESGLTDKQWCMENGIHVSTFYRHARILKDLSCRIPDGHKGQVQAPKQDVVPLQIIPDLPARDLCADTGNTIMPDRLHTAEPGTSFRIEETTGQFTPVLQVRFPNGVTLGISNLVNRSLFDSVISSLSGT